MRKLISVFIRFPFYANIILAIILVLGLFSFLSMNRSFFPDSREKFITISVFYPGASPKEMEEGITVRIEEALRGIAGIKEINSTSSENVTSVQLEVTGEYDIDETLMEVKNAVDGIPSFPVDAETPIVNKQRSVSRAAFMALTGDVDMLILKQYANEIENDFYNSGIISQISITGFPDLEISVEISEENLRRYNLTFDEVSRAIVQNNQDISGGQIRSDEEEIMIRSRYRTVIPEELEKIIIRANPDGTYLRIGDVGTVNMQFADVASTSLMNGKPTVSIQVHKLPEEDLIAISKFCNDYSEEWNETHDDTTFLVTFDFLETLKARLNLLYRNGGIGLLLIFITLGLFLSLRLSIWVAIGIPASFGAMFILAFFNGMTVNMISLFGMILVIGILVDDGIVIAENIYSHFEKGKSPRKAALDGTMEVLPSVLTSVATTIVVFSALFFIRGRMEFMYDMAFVVVFSLAFSLFEAFFVLPAHLGSSWVLRRNVRQNTGKKIRDILEKFLGFMRVNIYGTTLKFMIKWKYVAIFSPIFLIMITAGLFKGDLIKATFFPAIPFDQFTVDLAFKPGSGEAKTLDYLKRIDDAIWEVNTEFMEKFDDSIEFVSYTFLSTGSAFSGQERGSHAGNIFVMLRDLEGSGTSSFEIVDSVLAKVGELPEVDKLTIQGRATFGTPISVSLLGKNETSLNAAKEDLIQSLKQIEDINNIADVNPAGMREVRLKLKPLAYFLGFSQLTLTAQVRQGFFGDQAQRLQHGKDELRVWVRYPKTDRINLGQLEAMRIKTVTGEYPLSELAAYTIERGPVSIKHYNGSREIRVDANVVSYDTPIIPIQEKIESEIVPELLSKYPDIEVAYLGQKKDSDETMNQIKKFFLPAFLLMFLIIILHFKSFFQGMIIVSMIPLAWLGAIWGHGVEGVPVSLLSIWGMLALSGVIINDAVVFLSKYNSLLLEGVKVKDAVYQTGMARFRAIVLTTITTSVGLYPIIFEKSFNAQFLKPMAVSLAYGVFVGTAFILVFFPLVILFLNDMKRYSKYVYNRINLWVLQGDPKRKVPPKIVARLSQVPSRESVEIAIIHSKRTID